MRDGFVKAGGHNLYYRFIHEHYLQEDKPVLMFLHEGLGSIPQWKDFPSLLCEKLQLPGFLYERYGYGKSDPLTEDRQLDFLHREGLDVLPEVISGVGLEQPLHIVGHSDGGSIALIYASAFPENVISLVLEAPHVIIEKESKLGLMEAIWAYEKGEIKEKLMKYHNDHTDSTFYGWVRVWSSEEALKWNILNLLPKVQSPVLFIQGEDDQYGSIRQLDTIEDHVSAPVESWVIPDCGHIPHLQYKEEVIARICSFVS